MEKRNYYRWFKKGAILTLAVAMATVTFGCGSDDDFVAPVPNPSGNVVQGAVSLATVWADNLAAAGAGLTAANHKLDLGTSEEATTAITDATGAFTLGAVPSYDYVVVSSGGTDSITGEKAGQMLAPKGAKCVSPFTTMVALAPAGDQAAVKSAIESLGIKYDDKIDDDITPAALVVLQSVQSTVNSLTKTLQTASGDTLKTTETAAGQASAYAAIAAQIKGKTAAELTDTTTAGAGLSQILETSMDAAITDITTKYPGALNKADGTTPLTAADITALSQAVCGTTGGVVSSIVAAVATAVGSVSTAAADKKSEADLLDIIANPTKVQAIVTATTTTSTAASATVKVSAPANTAPVFAATPAPVTTGKVGTAYSFTPAATDAEDDVLTFSLASPVPGLILNPATGKLSGAPTAAGTYQVMITVSDGLLTAHLEFTLVIEGAATGGTGGTGGTI